MPKAAGALLGLWAMLAFDLRAEDPAARFREARPTARSFDAKGLTFPLGSGRYAFTAGTLYEIESTDGAPCGFYFEGSGSLSWRAADPEAARVFAANARRLGGFDVAKDGGITARFSRASFWLSPSLAPVVVWTGRSDPSRSLAAHRARFARDQVTPSWVGLAAASALGEDFGLALLEGKRDVRQQVDAALSGEERLSVVSRMEGAPIGFVDWRVGRDVARQPLGRGWQDAPAPAFHLTELDVNAREEGGEEGEIAADEVLVPQRPLRAVALELTSDALVRGGLSHHVTSMESVTDGDGRPLPFAFDRDTLLVLLPREAPAGVPLHLAFRYRAGFFARVAGGGGFMLGLTDRWYPVPHAWRAACRFTYHAVVRTKRPLVPLTSGEVVRREQDGEWNLLETRLARRANAVGLLAGAFAMREETRDGVTCRVATLGSGKGKTAARLTDVFFGLRRFYERLFGPLPWREHTIVEMPIAASQAPPGLTLIATDPSGFDPRTTGAGLIHELAHAWWGDVVWGATPEDQWIEEALAEVSAGHAQEILGRAAWFRQQANVWRARAERSTGEAPIWLANLMTQRASLRPDGDVSYHRIALVYDKGPALLERVRESAGDERFFGALRELLAAHAGAPAVTTKELCEALARASGGDLHELFARCYYGREMP